MRALTFGLLLPTPLPHGFKLILAAERQVGIKEIYSTNYKRTMDTGKPLADQLGLEVQTYNPRDASFISKLVEEKKRCTHLGRRPFQYDTNFSEPTSRRNAL